jgi:hypothetical protein
VKVFSIEAPFHALPFRLGETDRAARAVLPFHRVIVDRLPDVLHAIVVTSDLQGVEQTLDEGGPRSPGPLGEALARELDVLRAQGRLPPRENTAAILAGDLHPGADDADVRGVWLAFAGACRWVAGVAGNHDSFGGEERGGGPVSAWGRPNAHLLDGHILTLDGLRIGGISGVVSERGGRWARAESEFAHVTGRLAASVLDVLVSHDGPNVAGTDLPGWPSVRHALESSPATLVIRGHDPWPAPLATLANGTQVLNVEGRVCVLLRPG